MPVLVQLSLLSWPALRISPVSMGKRILLNRFKLELVGRVKWESFWKDNHAAGLNGVSQQWLRKGGFWSVPANHASLASASMSWYLPGWANFKSARNSPTDYRTLEVVSEICLETCWYHGSIRVLAATAEGWRASNFSFTIAKLIQCADCCNTVGPACSPQRSC